MWGNDDAVYDSNTDWNPNDDDDDDDDPYTTMNGSSSNNTNGIDDTYSYYDNDLMTRDSHGGRNPFDNKGGSSLFGSANKYKHNLMNNNSGVGRPSTTPLQQQQQKEEKEAEGDNTTKYLGNDRHGNSSVEKDFTTLGNHQRVVSGDEIDSYDVIGRGVGGVVGGSEFTQRGKLKIKNDGNTGYLPPPDNPQALPVIGATVDAPDSNHCNPDYIPSNDDGETVNDDDDGDDKVAEKPSSRSSLVEMSRPEMVPPLHSSGAAAYDSMDWNPGAPYPYNFFSDGLSHAQEDTMYGSTYDNQYYLDDTSNPFDPEKKSSLFGSAKIKQERGVRSQKDVIKNVQVDTKMDPSDGKSREHEKGIEASQSRNTLVGSHTDFSDKEKSDNQHTPNAPSNQGSHCSDVVQLEDKDRGVVDFNNATDNYDTVVSTQTNNIGLEDIKNHPSEIPSHCRTPKEESCVRKIRFADDEQGNNSDAKPGSSLSSNDTHPREIGVSRRHIMHSVPENSVPEPGALNFNTIVAHNRLHPSTVPEPVLSSMESCNVDDSTTFDGRKTSGKSNGSDSRRTRFSDEHTADGMPKSRRFRFWTSVLGIVMVLGASTVIAILLVSSGGDDDDEASDDEGPRPVFPPPVEEDVVSSLFENPAQVEWVLQGEVLKIFPNTTREISQLDDFVTGVELSATGTKLVVGTVDGSAVVYQWNNITRLWDEEANLEFPFDAVPTTSIQLPPSVTLSGDGKRLVIGVASVGRAYTYNYRENEDPVWLRHPQPFLENQDTDGTGAGVSLSYDGSMVAVGAPFFDGKSLNCGQIRLFRHNSIAWDFEAFVEGQVQNDNVGVKVLMSADARTAVGANQQNRANGFNSGIVWAWQRPVPSSSADNRWKLMGPPLLGPSELDLFGSQIDISASGRVLVVSSPGFASGAVFVYEFNYLENAWEQRGSPISSPGGPRHGVCISADGNVVVVATRSSVQVFQYQVARNAVPSLTSPREWVSVGGSFFNASQLSGGIVACSADGRIIAVGKSLSGNDSTVSVFRAVETL